METKKLRVEIQRITLPNGRKDFSKELRGEGKSRGLFAATDRASQEKIAETLSTSTMTVGR